MTENVYILVCDIYLQYFRLLREQNDLWSGGQATVALREDT